MAVNYRRAIHPEMWDNGGPNENGPRRCVNTVAPGALPTNKESTMGHDTQPKPAAPSPTRYHPKTWEDGVAPLSEFPAERRELIEWQVAQDQPPPRWLHFIGCQMESRAWYEWHWARGLKLRRRGALVPQWYRRKIPTALRLAVYGRDGHACLHCGTTESLSLDHIYPFSLGGLDTLENLQTLCRSCNSRKGARV